MTYSRNCSLSTSCSDWRSNGGHFSRGPAIAHSRIFATIPGRETQLSCDDVPGAWRQAWKMYSQGEGVLRVEAMGQNAEELQCGRLVEKFGLSVQRLKAILERFVEALSGLDRCFIWDGMRNDLPTAARVGTTRVGGVDFNSRRMQRVVRGLQALAAWPRGFTASQLASHVVAQKTGEQYAYSSRPAAYDLKKFRGKGIVRIGRSHRYETLRRDYERLAHWCCYRTKYWRPCWHQRRSPIYERSNAPIGFGYPL